jgi:hypothetical protein
MWWISSGDAIAFLFEARQLGAIPERARDDL